ncbi:MAG: hypothetical protein RBT38_02765 [Bacteroidales bacterium]|jgi:hypothetical protein|nr:hypothetical protein [Bacteroidales bacterium]
MKKTIILLNTVFLLMSPVTDLRGQLRENIYLHTDRKQYIAGEEIWFSIYNTDRLTGYLSSGSLIAYIELMSPWNTTVLQGRFELNGGKGEGCFAIPDSVASGSYSIRAYTNHMKNYLPEYCFIQEIEIFNPFRELLFFRRTSETASCFGQQGRGTGMGQSPFTIRADSLYGRREKVSLKLSTSNISYSNQVAGARMSVAVTYSGTPEYRNWEKYGTDRPANEPVSKDFENSGHILSGTVRNRETGSNIRPGFLFMSVQGKVAGFRYADIDSSGRFSFILPPDDRKRNLILQPDLTDGNMILDIDPAYPWGTLPSKYTKENAREELSERFSEMSFNYQASKIYGTTHRKDPEENIPDTLKIRRFYGIPEMEVFLDDYIMLPDMQEVFFELLPGILLRKSGEDYEIKITNPLTGVFYKEAPLVMIDGVILNNLNVLASLNPELVEKIEVVMTPYLIGDLILHGIVNIITRQGDFSAVEMPEYAVILPYRVTEPRFFFESPDYSDRDGRESRVPDLRNTLYWNPSVSADKNGEAEVTFWTSDLPGEYSVVLRGISPFGEKILAISKFLVR